MEEIKPMLIKNISIIFISFSLLMPLAIAQDANKKPELILLKPYQSKQQLNIKNWYMSEKLDGVRAYWDGHALYSRNGNRFAAPDWFIKGFPEFELDGELWTKRGDFEHIVSIVQKQSPHDGWHEISYQIFEVPNAPGNLSQRLDKIRLYLQNQPSSVIKIIPQQNCNGDAHLQSFLDEIEKLGGEGVVLRDPELSYHIGRSHSSLKVKRFQDAECKVTGYKEGRGKFKGLTGALYCQMADMRIITIGSGLTNDERKNPPAIGTIITYKYNGYTLKGKPRFPVYLRTRKTL